MTDALANFKPSTGTYLKFNDGDEVKLRVLTLDPLVSEKTFENKQTGEISISTKYGFVVWNWNENKPQVMEVGPGLLTRFTKIHQDEDLPPLNKADIKISATGEMLGRRYDVVVLPSTKEMTPDMVKQAAALKLEDMIKDSKGRLSQVSGEDGEEVDSEPKTSQNGSTQSTGLKAEWDRQRGGDVVDENIDEPLDFGDLGDPRDPVDLDDIPF